MPVEKKKENIEEKLKPFKEIEVDGRGLDEVLDDFILALNNSDLDSAKAEKYLRRYSFAPLFSLIAGVLLIGFAAVIILVPLPKYLEVKTLFYFNPNDGITVSDLVGGVVLFAGIIISVTGMSSRKHY